MPRISFVTFCLAAQLKSLRVQILHIVRPVDSCSAVNTGLRSLIVKLLTQKTIELIGKGLAVFLSEGLWAAGVDSR